METVLPAGVRDQTRDLIVQQLQQVKLEILTTAGIEPWTTRCSIWSARLKPSLAIVDAIREQLLHVNTIIKYPPVTVSYPVTVTH